jgi:eukaryotic-like serine/threonine-protein kinase
VSVKRRTGRFGAYEVLDVVGRGGIAEVLRARAPNGEVVAIKHLRPAPEGAETEELAATLKDEARLLGCIRHENVVRIRDTGLDGSNPFVVMDFVDGAPLRTLLAVQPGGATERGDVVERCPVEVAVSIVCDVLEGLHAAHSAVDEHGRPLEIVHRDISPENILVARSGKALITDFGVALARDRLQRTVSNQIKGKVHYIAPEQVHGVATSASDVFAVGAVLYEVLVGHRLIRARATSEALAELLSLRVVRPSARGVTLPAPLEDALLRSLARRPEARFSSAQDFARALATAVPEADHASVAGWVGPRLPVTPAPTSRARRVAIAATIAIVALVLVAIVRQILRTRGP